MYELKKNGKVFTGKFVGTGPSSYEKRIYRAAVSQRLGNTGVEDGIHCQTQTFYFCTCIRQHCVLDLHASRNETDLARRSWGRWCLWQQPNSTQTQQRALVSVGLAVSGINSADEPPLIKLSESLTHTALCVESSTPRLQLIPKMFPSRVKNSEPQLLQKIKP